MILFRYFIFLSFLFPCMNLQAMKQSEENEEQALVLNTEGIVSKKEAEDLLYKSDLPAEIKYTIHEYAYFEESDAWLLNHLSCLRYNADKIIYQRPKDDKILKIFYKDKAIHRQGDGLEECVIDGWNSVNAGWGLIGASFPFSHLLLRGGEHLSERKRHKKGGIAKEAVWIFDREKRIRDLIYDGPLCITCGTVNSRKVALVNVFLSGEDGRGHLKLIFFHKPNNERKGWKQEKSVDLGAVTEDFCLERLNIQAALFSPSGNKIGIKLQYTDFWLFNFDPLSQNGSEKIMIYDVIEGNTITYSQTSQTNGEWKKITD